MPTPADKEPEDTQFLFRRLADFDLLIVALTRLRRTALLARKVPAIEPHMRAALADFDRVIPHLKKLRDVAEHIDDYAMDLGKDRSIRRQALEVSSWNTDTLCWFSHTLDAEDALAASQRLFKAIQDAQAPFVQKVAA